jgi:hypothetical protein
MGIFQTVSRFGLALLIPIFAGASATKPTPSKDTGGQAASATAPAERIVVSLEKIDAMKAGDEVDLVRGHLTPCETQPATDVKYPAFKGSNPLYGQAEFDRKYIDDKEGIRFAFAIDRPGQTGKGQERLYFDLNQDGDLTNDPFVKPMKDPPEWSRYKGEELTEVIFNYLAIQFDHGSPSGKQPFVVLPCLNTWRQEHSDLCLIATEARKGKFKIGSKGFAVYLSQTYTISGRYDRPFTRLRLVPDGQSGRRYGWWGGDRLSGMHVIEGSLYQFSATTKGDKLFVEPYGGEFGLLRAGVGQRKIEKAMMRGSLMSESRGVAIGPVTDDGWPEETAEASIPVGDYTPEMLDVRLGRLAVDISNNYHTDGTPRKRDGRIVYGIKIRKDQPFVFDFANKPDMLFACPARDKVLHPGEEINIQAVLIDPVLDTMIRGLTDTTRKQKKEQVDGEGRTFSYEQDLSLDPTVVVTDADGKRVAEGVMPFG